MGENLTFRHVRGLDLEITLELTLMTMEADGQENASAWPAVKRYYTRKTSIRVRLRSRG